MPDYWRSHGMVLVRKMLFMFGAAAVVVAALAPSAAADHGPAEHAVRYIVTAQEPTNATLYYRDTDPPSFADYSHDPYLFSPSAHVFIRPDTPWIMNATLADPDNWAMVVVSTGPSLSNPQFHCELSVDHILVRTSDGTRGALCATRPS